MTHDRSRSTIRTALVAITLTLALVTLGAGQAAAHNPACHQTAGADGPHYDDDPRTGSPAAFAHNPTLGGSLYPEHANGAEGCSVGNAGSTGNGH